MMFLWCRFAQPLTIGCHPSGMVEGEHIASLFPSDAGGIKSSSRGLSEAIPPESGIPRYSTPVGVPSVWGGDGEL